MIGVRLCGGVAVEVDGRPLPEPLLAGRQGRLVLAYLVCERDRSVPREELAELLWGERPPSSWPSALSSVISKLRRLFGEAGLDGTEVLASAFGSYRLHLPADAQVDREAAAEAVEQAELALRDGDGPAAVAVGREAVEIARRGFLTDDCPWVDLQRERLRDVLVRATQAQAHAHLLTGERSRAVSAARDALELDELREESYRLLMQALTAAGERGEALRVWERCRIMLVEELGTNPAPETEAVYLKILEEPTPVSAATTPAPTPALPSGVVTFLLTDIVDSSGLWERDPTSMENALVRHDEIVAGAVSAHGGVLLKAKLEGDATVSVFPRASAGAMAAVDLRESLANAQWPEGSAPQVRMALHTGEAVERNGDYFGPALNRAARLRSLAAGGQILLSQAVAEVVRDHLPPDSTLRSLGERQLRGMARAEHVYELVGQDHAFDAAGLAAPLERPPIPAVLAARGPFVGRDSELDRLAVEWANATAGTARAVLIAGEPGVGKTRLAAEWARKAYQEGGLVLYGRCDEEFGAPYQPFAEALRDLVPRLGASRLRSVRGVDQLARLAPELADVLPDLPGPAQADPDTERALLFDALARLLAAASAELPILVVVDDLHWAAKPTLLLLRHLLRAGDGMRLQVVGTYRSTDLDRTHPLAGVLADLHRDGTTERLTLSGLDAEDVSAYLSAAGYEDARLGHALSSVTSGNPFFLIEVLHHLDETGGRWDPNTLPQGVREAVGRRLSRLSDATNETLLVGAVIGSQFDLRLAERVLERDLVDQIDEARRAGLVAEEAGGRFRFSHALVRQSLLSEVASVKRVRLHQRVATALEADPSGAGREAHLAELAHHWFECAFAGGAAKAVDYSRRAAEQAMVRLAYEEAAEIYDHAIQAAEIEGSGCGEPERAQLLLARCEALLAAGDPATALAVVDQLQAAARNSPSLSAWASCYAAQLGVLTHPERLDAIEADAAAAAQRFVELDDAEGEAKAHTVRASCLARLGRIGDCEAALDQALTAGRRAGNPRRVNAVLAGAPLAALWGPGPIARASGRCLDVVRVLRITTGSPAVEAVALRCQAVLEALRGRTDAARRMLTSARRHLEGLGHNHGLFETDVFAGIVELVAGEPGAAETFLRRAYDWFVARGVGVDAAQAAAQLARAVLALNRVDEAMALTVESERLAGVDLQAAITWRSARAEVLARQGAMAEALDAARAAVALADPTDALIFQGDAHLSLAVVLRAAGDEAEAERETRRAVALYERKGATARTVVTRAATSPNASTEALLSVVPSGRRRRFRTNAAQAAALRVNQLFAQRQWDAHDALFADEFEDVDHISHITCDLHTYWHSARLLADKEGIETEIEPVASLGNRHTLNRGILHYSGASMAGTTTGDVEAAYLWLWSVDAAGRLIRLERFAPDDLHNAFARMVELHADDELPSDQRDGRYRVAAQYRDLRIDWADDAILVDHRPTGLGELHGREAITRAAIAMRGLSADFRFRITDALNSTERAALLEIVSEGHDEYGGPVEISVLAVNIRSDDGFVQRQEWFLPEQVEEALARFDELTGGVGEDNGADEPAALPAEKYLVNDAIRQMARVWQWNLANDRPRMLAGTAEDCVIDDRRPIVGSRSEGREAVMAVQRSMVEIGVTNYAPTPIATRGERLMLSRELYYGRDGETETLSVHEIGPDGKWLHSAIFDPDDLDTAFAELDARYAAGEGAPVAQNWATLCASIAAYNARAWTTFAAFGTEDLTTVDHRPLGFGTVEARAFFDLQQATIELASDARMRIIAVLRATEMGIAWVLQTTGVSAAGAAFETVFVAVSTFEGGLVKRLEVFPPQDLATALSRLDELTRPSALAVPDNAATRLKRRFGECLLQGDIDAFVDLHSATYVMEDRRPGLRSDVTAASVREQSQMLSHFMGRQGEQRFLATRGDTLALEFVTLRGSAGRGGGDAEISFLTVNELDSEGRLCFQVAFDPDDLDGAFAELDARYLAGEGQSLRLGVEMITAYNTRDWVALERLLHDDATVVDHRTAGLGTLDRAGMMAAWLALVEVAPSLKARIISILKATQTGALAIVRTTGTDDESGYVELEFLEIAIAHGGKFSHIEFYPLDQTDVALTRFNELTSSDIERALVSPNAAALVARRAHDALARKDPTAYGACHSQDALVEDRRRVVGGYTLHGRSEIEDNARAMGVVSSVGITLVATRGDRLVINRYVYRGQRGGGGLVEVETLSLGETDDEGLFRYVLVVDSDDLDAAFAELDSRYLAGEGAASPVSRFGVEMLAAYNARDWRALENLSRDDAVALDHRPRGWGQRDRAGMISALRGLVELAPGLRARQIATVKKSTDATLSVVRLSGTDTEGGQVELEFIDLVLVRQGLLARFEAFSLGQADLALARFDELSSSAMLERVPANSATRMLDRYFRLLADGDLDAFLNLHTDDYVLDDRRTGVRVQVEGPSVRLQAEGMIGFLGGRLVVPTVLATAGDHLDLARATMRGSAGVGGEAEIEYLFVGETRADGRIRFCAMFDPDDLVSASDELLKRHFASLGMEEAERLKLRSDYFESWNGHDFSSLLEMLADDFVAVDHRTAGWGRLDADQWIALAEELGRRASDASLSSLAVHAVTPNGIAERIVVCGTVPDGGPFENLLESVSVVERDKVTRIEIFDFGQIDDAVQRLAELADAPSTDG